VIVSICFTWFSIGGYMSIQYITSIGLFYKNWGFYLGGVWLWRISGGTHRRWWGWF